MTDNDKPRTCKRKSLLLRFSYGLLVVWLVPGIIGGIFYKDQFAASWITPKLDVPVVVIESDDWGLDYASRFVVPSRELDTQQAGGVKILSQALAAHHDCVGRNPIASAFIVVHQADTPAIAKDPRFEYHSRPIDQTMPRTVAALKDAASKGLFSLVYHGRDHRDAGLWALKVQKAAERFQADGKEFDPEIVTTFLPRYDSREQDRMHAEYFDSRTGYLEALPQGEVDRKVAQGLGEFERIFGKRPVSTVPPRYLWGPQAEAAFRANGIRYLHGANKQGGRYRGAGDIWTRSFGVRLSGPLVGIPRNADLEAGVQTSTPDPRSVIEPAEEAIAAGQPVVISTHAANYCSPNVALSQTMGSRLGEVLSSLESRHPNLRYLSSEELGQLGETGRVSISSANLPPSELRVATGLRHAWLWAVGIYEYRTKARWYLKGLGILVVCVLAATAAHLLRRRTIAPQADSR